MNEYGEQGEQTETPGAAEADDQSAQPCPVCVQPYVCHISPPREVALTCDYSMETRKQSTADGKR